MADDGRDNEKLEALDPKVDLSGSTESVSEPFGEPSFEPAGHIELEGTEDNAPRDTELSSDRTRISDVPRGTRASAQGAMNGSLDDLWGLHEVDVDEPQLRQGQYIHHYQLIRELGRGGMGVVYLARDVKLARRVAIKFLLRAHGDSTERFIAEARVTARCRHDNIVVIHDIDEHRDIPFMVLEYLQGRSFRQLFHDRKVTPQRAVELIIPVVRALKRAHEEQIVHRDLKPENIFLTDSGAVKVLDFGIAKLMTRRVAAAPGTQVRDEQPLDTMDLGPPGRDSGSGALLGTLPYMAPEQLDGGEIDHQSDLWAVGIMLYELVTGRHPLQHHGGPGLMTAITADEHMPRVRDDPNATIPDPLAEAIDRCLLKDRSVRTASAAALLAELEACAVIQGTATVEPGDHSPFPGLSAFQEGDGARFFGRDRDIATLCAQLRANPFIAVVGPSGTGKSSLVRAGVVPALKRSGEGWDAHVIRPGRSPLAALASVMESWRSLATNPDLAASPDRNQFSGLLRRLRVEPGYLGALLRERAGAAGRHTLLFIDQLEELYTLDASDEERETFFACLAGVADDPTSPLRVVAAVRSDYIDRLAEDRDITNQTLLTAVPPMQRAGLRDALVEPVEAVGFGFESPELVDRMLDELDETAEPLPLLQFAASQLWEQRDRDRSLLTADSYRAIGGVAGALASHADGVLDGMAARDQQVAREVFERLVTPERTRSPTTLEELREASRHPEQVEKVVQHLVKMRLLIVDSQRDGTSVEIAHEALIREWPTLNGWLDKNADDAEFLGRLLSAAGQWEKSGKDEGLLWRGDPARQAREWHERRTGSGEGSELGVREERYLGAVFDLADRDQRRRRRVAMAAIGALAVISLVLAYLTVLARAEASRARNANRVVAAESSKNDPTTVVALLRELEAGPVSSVWSALALWALSSEVAENIVKHPQGVRSVAFSPDGAWIATGCWDKVVRVWSIPGGESRLELRGHESAVTSVSFSPDGRHVVSSSDDHTARLWKIDTNELESIVLRGHTGPVLSAAFAPDGERIVTASSDGTIRLWSIAGGEALQVLRGHESDVTSAHYDPGGGRIVSSSMDKTVRVWPADGAGAEVIWSGHEAAVRWASFSPDGRRVASAGDDKTVRVWTLDGSAKPLVLSGHTAPITSVVFDPGGERVISASYDETIKIWDADGSDHLVSLRGHDAGVMSVHFSRSGRWLASASNDDTVRIWSLDQDRQHTTLRGHSGRVMAAAFNSDGRLVVSGAEDETVRVWQVDTAEELGVRRGHEAIIMATSFSPDNRYLVSGAWDHTIRVWPVHGSSEDAKVFRGHESEVFAAVFDATGERIVSGSADETVRIWSVKSQTELQSFRDHEGAVLSAAFSPDSLRVVSTSMDETAQIWSADGQGRAIVLRHPGWVWWGGFSADGERVVTACQDGNVRIWDADGTGEPLVLRGHGGPVYSASFSRDGARVLSSSRDRTLRIWNADGSGEPLILRGHDGGVNRAAFSPDGKRVVSPSDDQTVRVWTLPEPIERDDRRLWEATRYCPSPQKRRKLLGVSEDVAEANHQRCRERVAAIHAR